MNGTLLDDAHLPPPALRAEGITVDVRGAQILRGVDMAVRPGEVHGLIGPNGAGKSTLLRTVAGLVRPTSGQVWAGDVPVRHLAPRDRARLLAFLPQDTTITAALDVRTVVSLGRYAHRPRLSRWRGDLDAVDAGIVDAALARVGVTHLADRPVTALSGGQRQLALIAKQLAQQSRVLLLDEPVSALDIGYQLEVLDLLRGLADDGHGIAVVLHDLNLAARSCHRLTVIADGRVRCSGRPESVLVEDVIDDLYGIRSVVDRDPATGAVRVTALARAARPTEPPHVDPARPARS